MICHYFTGEQEVKSLFVRCKTGCGWTGELRLVEDHKKKDCPNTLIPCPRGCNNGSTKVVRRNKELHLQSKCPNRPYTCATCEQEMEFRNARSHKMLCPKRLYNCPHCNEPGMYDERTTTHLTVCTKIKVLCSKCYTQIMRCDESNHHLDCQHEPVRCKYYNIGCGEKPLRKGLSKHEENAQLHLSLATDKVLKLTGMLVLKNTQTIKITSFKQKKLQANMSYSSGFSTSEKGYKMCLVVYANGEGDAVGTHVTVGAFLMKGDHDGTLTWPFTGSVTIELLNQLEDKNHHRETLTFPADHEASKRVVDGERAGKGYGWPKFISHTALDYDASANTQYLKDDTLVFRVSAEAPDHKPWLECTDTV